MRVGTGEGYTGTPPVPSQYPYLTIFKAKGPTHGQMKAILRIFMRFLRYDLRLTSDIPQNDLRIDPPGPPPGLVPRWPPDPDIPDLRYPMLRIGLI